MSKHHLSRWITLIVSAALLSACAANNSAQVVTTEPLPTPTSLSTPTVSAETTPDPTPAPNAETTPDPSVVPAMRVRLWLPEPLAPASNSAALGTLTEQIAAFDSENIDLEIDVRLKRANDIGGILQTLRTASTVAPDALPDLTLMRRADLLIAGDERLIQPFPLTGTTSSAGSLITNLPPTVAALGMIDTTLYGLPYLIDLQHIAYYSDFISPETWTFDTLIDEGVTFTFPVGRGSGRSDVLTAQVLASGADTDPDAFLRLLRFYERAVDAGLIDAFSLDTLAPSEYRMRLANGEIRAAVVNASDYLDLRRMGADIAFAPLPSEDGRAVTPLDGWMWVITTTDNARLAAARRLLDWLNAPERLAAYSLDLGLLPATQTALRLWDDDLGDYTAFVGELIQNAVLTEQLSPTTARAMQMALISVLTGEQTAEQAAQAVNAAT